MTSRPLEPTTGIRPGAAPGRQLPRHAWAEQLPVEPDQINVIVSESLSLSGAPVLVLDGVTVELPGGIHNQEIARYLGTMAVVVSAVIRRDGSVLTQRDRGGVRLPSTTLRTPSCVASGRSESGDTIVDATSRLVEGLQGELVDLDLLQVRIERVPPRSWCCQLIVEVNARLPRHPPGPFAWVGPHAVEAHADLLMDMANVARVRAVHSWHGEPVAMTIDHLRPPTLSAVVVIVGSSGSLWVADSGFRGDLDAGRAESLTGWVRTALGTTLLSPLRVLELDHSTGPFESITLTLVAEIDKSVNDEPTAGTPLVRVDPERHRGLIDLLTRAGLAQDPA